MKTLLLTAAVLAGGAAFTQASAASGDISLSYDHVGVDTSGGSDLNGATLSGNAVFELRGTFQVGLTESITYASVDDGGDGTQVGGVAHFVSRNPGWTGGLFLGAEGGDFTPTFVTVGYEHFFYLPQATVGGGVGYINANNADADGWFGALEGRYFYNPDIRFDLNANYAKLDFGSGDVDGWQLGVGAEKQFTGTPYTVFAAYRHGDVNDYDLKTDSISIGVRLTSDSSLFDRDRSGASFLNIPSLVSLY